MKKRHLIFLGIIFLLVLGILVFRSKDEENYNPTGSVATPVATNQRPHGSEEATGTSAHPQKRKEEFKEGVYEGETPSYGSVAGPDFVLKDLKGKEVSLKRFRGKIVLLNFWATWCPPCRKEIPSMIELYKRYKDRGLEIIGVNLDKLDKSGVEKFSLEYNINFPILLDPTGKVATLYGITALPATFILDQNGKIQERFAGGKDWSSEENLKKFETFLNEKE